ncbi:uncharacterized protein [Miscanthus floridulus]|uniref:uncharacterized protein isoform X2 n=1 Tax=Miscanthus floridulus TaxID=154761 RepID=UPI00345AF188
MSSATSLSTPIRTGRRVAARSTCIGSLSGRPCSTCHRRVSSTGELSAKTQANFRQALASGKRLKSHVLVPFNCDEHDHDAEYSCAKRSMREPQQKLAVLTQGSENASVSKMGTPLSALENSLTSICPPNSCSPLYGHSTNPKIVASDNVQNQLERKRSLIRKVYTSKKRLSKKKEGFEDPLESPSTGQKIRVNEIDGPQREPSLVLERSESTQLQLDSTLEDTVNTNEVKYEEPVAVVPLSFESASDGSIFEKLVFMVCIGRDGCL